MTWIKPFAAWMGYRCGWTLLKDKNQARVLALRVPLDKFYGLLAVAAVSSGEDSDTTRGGARATSLQPISTIN